MSEPSPHAPAASIPAPPRGLALLAAIGPAFIWCGEFIGSGEVILSTRLGAVLGTAILWVPAVAIILKCWIGMGGARYAVCTGEGMIDLFNRMPGPRGWCVWIVLVAQTAGAILSIGALGSAIGAFAHALAPFLPAVAWSWIFTGAAVALVAWDRFEWLKRVMSLLVGIIVVGVAWVALRSLPGARALLDGVFGFAVPAVPDWAQPGDAPPVSAWSLIVPVTGWAAGGFASQVWYSYWILGAGFGMAHGRTFGRPADAEAVRTMTPETAQRLRGWCRLVHADATTAMAIGLMVTLAFVLAGAAVLGPQHVALSGKAVASSLADIFGREWGRAGRVVFILLAWAAFFSTQIGQLAGWPRLLADAYRICVPAFGRLPWKTQFRLFLGVFLATNLVITYAFGFEPVKLIEISAFADGVLLVPLQAAAVLFGLYVVLPRMLPEHARAALRPHAIFALMLAAGAVAYLGFTVARFVL